MRSFFPLRRSFGRLQMTSYVLIAIGLVGCSRTWHRRDADQEVACVIAGKGGELGPNGVYADPQSRLADPSRIDCPPMPPDDPESNRLMDCVDGERAFDWDRFGRIPQVESLAWQDSLNRNEKGEV
ncbi:MAG: hypothetical protein AAFX06_25365, partial [Planctomycetota bacterium]